MSEGLTPNQKAYLRSLVSSGYLPTIEENAKRLTAPYYWYDPSQPEANVKGGGTICFVRTDQRLLGITAGHIHQQCVEDLDAYPDCSCQIGGHTFYGAGGQDAPSPHAVGLFFDRRRPHGLDCPVDDSGWGGVRSQGPHRSPEDVHSRRVLRSGAGTILLSGTLWPIASFGSPGVHSL